MSNECNAVEAATDEELIELINRCTQSHNQRPVITLERIQELIPRFTDSEAGDIDLERLEELLDDIIEQQSRIVIEKIDVDGTPVYAGSEFGHDLVMLGLVEKRHLFHPGNFDTHDAAWFYDTHGTRGGWTVPDYPYELREALQGESTRDMDDAIVPKLPRYLFEEVDDDV